METSRFDGMTDGNLMALLSIGDPDDQMRARVEVRRRLIDRKFALDSVGRFVEDALLDPPNNHAAYLNAIKKIIEAVGIIRTNK